MPSGDANIVWIIPSELAAVLGGLSSALGLARDGAPAPAPAPPDPEDAA